MSLFVKFILSRPYNSLGLTYVCQIHIATSGLIPLRSWNPAPIRAYAVFLVVFILSSISKFFDNLLFDSLISPKCLQLCTFSSFLSLNEKSISALFFLHYVAYLVVFVLVSLTWYLSLPAKDRWIFNWHCSSSGVSAINNRSSATPTTPRYIEPIHVCNSTSRFVTQSNNGFKKCLYPVGDHTPPWRTPWHSGNGNDISPSRLTEDCRPVYQLFKKFHFWPFNPTSYNFTNIESYQTTSNALLASMKAVYNGFPMSIDSAMASVSSNDPHIGEVSFVKPLCNLFWATFNIFCTKFKWTFSASFPNILVIVIRL